MIGLSEVLDSRRDAAAHRAQSIAAQLRDAGSGSVAVHVELEAALDDLERYERLAQSLRAAASSTDVYTSGRASFLGDLINFRTDDAASARLSQLNAQHGLVDQRDIGLGSITNGLPQSMLTALAEGARPGRPFLDAIGPRELPAVGSTLVPLRVSTTVTAGASLEGAAVTDTNPTVASSTPIGVVMVSARTRCSRTLFQRGGQQALELGVIGELVAAVEAEADRLAIVGTGTAPQPLGVLATAGISTTAVATAANWQELLTKIGAGATASSAASRLPAELVVMHSRRAAWIGSRADGLLDPGFAAGRVLGGLLRVIIDDNVPTNLGAGTNEDRIVILRRADVAFYESPMQIAVLDQTAPTAPGQVDICAFRFIAVDTSRRPAALSVLTGAALSNLAT